MQPVYIVSAARTPQGRFLGGLAKQSAADLALAAGRKVLDGIDPAVVELVVLGNVLGAGQGMNVARQVGVRLGLPIHVPAFTVNMMCASGLQAALLGAQAIRAGEAEVVLCGGVESMSNAPYLLQRARAGYKLGDGTLVDALLRDGLVDSFDGEHMGLGAERLAARYALDRERQDRFALRSQERAAAAQADGAFDAELVPVGGVARDEHPRPGTTLAQLGQLQPAFREGGAVTAGNASGLNDGAAMLLLAGEAAATRLGLRPLARLGAGAVTGCDPAFMGLGPVHATRKLLGRSGGELDGFDTIELNEAFAAQALACLHELGCRDDDPRVNPEGGAIALGHPIGASGARLLVHLAHRVQQRRTERGLATLCVGGGMGAAATVEAV